MADLDTKISLMSSGAPALDTDLIYIAGRGAGVQKSLTLSEVVKYTLGKLYFNIKSYGADPTASYSTNTTAINACIAACVAAGGGIVLVPPGTYKIKVAGAADNILYLGGKNVHLMGWGRNASILKVDNSCADYKYVLSDKNGGSYTDVAGFECEGITIDFNIANQSPGNAAHILSANYMDAIGLFSGTDFSIHDCAFINGTSVNVITINGSAVRNVNISRNLFKDNGDDPGHAVHDVSLIYTSAYRVIIADNVIEAATPSLYSAITGIEVHGNDTIVTNNIIKNYACGIIGCGIDVESTKNLNIIGNTISDCAIGVELWSTQYPWVTPTHTTGFGIDGCVVKDNTIHLSGLGVYTTVGVEWGIIIYPFTNATSDELDVNGLIIDGNTIIHPLEPTSPAVTNNTASMAIGWPSQDQKVLHNSRITSNIIVNFPLAGINLSCGNDNNEISGNQLINCGSTKWSTTAAYKSPIIVNTLTDSVLTIRNNTIVDNNAVTRIPKYIYINRVDAANPTNLRVWGNLCICTGDGVSLGAADSAVTQYPFDYSISPTWTGTHIFSNDLKLTGDNVGLMKRIINPLGTTVTDHFRSGSIPSGYAWLTATGFDGTPSLNYSWASDYLQAIAGSSTTKTFLNKAIPNVAGNWQNQKITIRCRGGNNVDIGVRIDDASDSNYVEVVLAGALNNGTVRLDLRSCVATVLTTTSSSIIVPVHEFFTIQLNLIYSGGVYRAYGYIVCEDGATVQPPSFWSAVLSWMPVAGRAGIVFKGNANYCFADWFYNTFA